MPVGLAAIAGGDGQAGLVDVRSQSGGRADAVVTSEAAIAAIAQGSSDRDCLPSAGIGAVEDSGQAIQANGFAAYQAVEAATGEGCRRRPVIGLVESVQADDGQDLGRNVACHTGRVVDRVVAGQAGAVGNAHPCDRHRLAGACVFVGECAGATRHHQRLTADQTSQAATRQRGCQGAVISARGGRHARQRQGFWRDAGNQASRVADGVVGRQAAIVAVDQGCAGHRHRLAGAGVLDIEGGG